MPVSREFSDEELPSVREVLNRAMNTWEPHNWPIWLSDFSDAVDLRLSRIEKEREKSAEEGLP